MNLLQAYFHHLEEGYDGDCNKYVPQLFNWKVRTSSSKQAAWLVKFEAFRIVIDSTQ